MNAPRVPPRIGLGYRQGLAGFIREQRARIGCIEITAEHFFDCPAAVTEWRAIAPLFVHGLGLSLGTPGRLDSETLRRFAAVSAAAKPEWVSEHIAFTRTDDVDFGHLNPLLPSRRTLETLSGHVRELADTCGRPVLLENITSHLRLEGELSETEFLNELCRRAECGLLLDVTNLFINSRNHGFDPYDWLRAIEPAVIMQLHIVGYGEQNGQLVDFHGHGIQPDLLELLGAVLKHAPVKAIILERDERLADTAEVLDDLRKLEALCA